MDMTTPREVFALMSQRWLSNSAGVDRELLTEDVIVEMPFAAPGRPARIVGRDAFVAFAEAGRAALPVRFDECRTLAVHDTVDPAEVVVEYELVGTHTVTGVTAAARFIGVLRTDGGRIALWREY